MTNERCDRFFRTGNGLFKRIERVEVSRVIPIINQMIADIDSSRFTILQDNPQISLKHLYSPGVERQPDHDPPLYPFIRLFLIHILKKANSSFRRQIGQKVTGLLSYCGW